MTGAITTSRVFIRRLGSVPNSFAVTDMKEFSTWAFLHFAALRIATTIVFVVTHMVGNGGASSGHVFLTQYGTRAPSSNTPSPSLRDATSQTSSGVFNDIALGTAVLMSPFVAACLIRAMFSWCRRVCEKGRPVGMLGHEIYEVTPGQQGESTPRRSHPFVVGSASSPNQQIKSKSVTWQSPFNTRARSSNRSHATGDLRFLMVTTPEKLMSTRGSRGNHTSPGITRPPRPTVSHIIPKFCLEQLDSFSSSSASETCHAASVQADSPSPVPMLQDSGEYDSDSPRVSVSSAISDDPEHAVKVGESLCSTQQDTTQTLCETRGENKLLHSSSSLYDFRHDIHIESDHGETEPELITRSSEYSF